MKRIILAAVAAVAALTAYSQPEAQYTAKMAGLYNGKPHVLTAQIPGEGTVVTEFDEQGRIVTRSASNTKGNFKSTYEWSADGSTLTVNSFSAGGTMETTSVYKVENTAEHLLLTADTGGYMELTYTPEGAVDAFTDARGRQVITHQYSYGADKFFPTSVDIMVGPMTFGGTDNYKKVSTDAKGNPTKITYTVENRPQSETYSITYYE